MRTFDIPDTEIIDKYNKIQEHGWDSVDAAVTKIHKHYEPSVHTDLTYLLRYHIANVVGLYNTNKIKK